MRTYSPGPRLGIGPATVAAIAASAFAVLPAQAADDGADEAPRLQAEDPRAYGWRIGDDVRRTLHLRLPPGWTLDDKALPRPGRGGAIELRQVRHEERAEGGVRVHRIVLHYQVLTSPPQPRVLELPAVVLDAVGSDRRTELRADAAPIAVTPLLGAGDAPARRGLGELQPDRPPPRAPESERGRRALALGALALASALAWALAWFGAPWWSRRRRPFATAWRQVRGLGADPPADAWRAACQAVHTALNRRAGGALFEPGLQAWLQTDPRFGPLHAPLAEFLQRSRREFFGGGGRSAGDGAWLVDLARRCRDAERG